jgi:hypothetical protein
VKDLVNDVLNKAEFEFKFISTTLAVVIISVKLDKASAAPPPKDEEEPPKYATPVFAIKF